MTERVDMAGSTIASIHRGDDYLYFTTDKGVFKFVVDADCCSHTWINDLTGVPNVLGKQVTAVEDIEAPSPIDNDGGDYIQFYAKEFRTTGGVLTVCYRNSSNGYYGGSLEGPYKAEFVPAGFSSVTDDWSL
jgi:hypothetical protein